MKKTLRIFSLTDGDVRLLKQIWKDGKVSRKTQKIFKSRLGFYISIWQLRDYGLVEEDSIGNDMSKFWRLTDKGKELIEHITKIEEILGEKSG